MSRGEFSSDRRCTYVERESRLPSAIWIRDDVLVGPFCARCSHPWWRHAPKDGRCRKYLMELLPPEIRRIAERRDARRAVRGPRVHHATTDEAPR